MELEPWVPERITIIVLMKLDRILLDVSYKLLIFPDYFSSCSAVSALGVSASLQLGNRPPPSTGWLGTWSWKFLPLLLIFSSGPSLRINLQYQPSGGEWCIPHTPRIYALVWLPLNPEWLPILPWRVFTHRWIWFCCFSGVELQRALDWRESHMYNENVLKGFNITAPPNALH